jgi:prolyl-tRNA synthetase
MRLSQSLIPTLKEIPAEAQIASHRLMLRAGLVRQMASGIYAWLPAGLRVLNKIADIVREEQDLCGAQELLMPTIQSADLWRESGRYDAYGKEMLRITDRHERELLFGPTNEEMITAILRDTAKSYRDLPQVLYHIQWKFRDEVRPRFGVLRGREFLMKDAYSFDLDYEGAVLNYKKMLLAYMRTFQRIGITAIPMRADTGQIGGDLSHEFHVLAPTGESGVFYDAAFESGDALSVGYEAVAAFYEANTTKYAATDEKHDLEAWAAVPDERKREGRGIEVGQIFYFGKKYSETMGFSVIGKDGAKIFPEMGSYGIGVSRLVGAIIEASHDEAGIIWPDAIAPFRAAILNLRQGDAATDEICESLHEKLGAACLYDDREERAGAKFAEADLMGHPWQIIVGPRGAAAGKVELKRRATGERLELTVDEALAKVLG